MKQSIVIIEAPGKVRAWNRASKMLGVSMHVVTTRGHMCRFPDQMSPFGIRFENGRAIDHGRVPSEKVTSELIAAVEDAPRGTPILIATDDDHEGDVIALDVFRVLFAHNRSLIPYIKRVRARSVTLHGISMALDAAEKNPGLDDLVSRAVPGQARAITDRWIGLCYSRIARTGCGRVRAAMLGASLLWANDAPNALGIPETGEITFQVRAYEGGLPFSARVPIRGKPTPVLMALAERYKGRLLPGHVMPMASLSAAVAPRIGNVPPFNTGDAIAYAGRFHGVPAGVAMRGLQDAYMSGRISYPRTSSRSLSPQAADLVVQCARASGIRDADISHAERHLTTPGDGAHEALYPTPELRHQELETLRNVVRSGNRKPDLSNPSEIEDLMVCLVARRAFESARSAEMMPGVWRNREGSDITEEEIEALYDLEWTRPAVQGLPWSQNLSTGVRIWPMSSVLIEGMMIEGVGRPSTWAAHADSISSSGQMAIPSPGRLPVPTPEGRRILKALPKGAWIPGLCRAIEAAISQDGADEGDGQDVPLRVRKRMDAWVSAAPEPIREALVEELMRENVGDPLQDMSKGIGDGREDPTAPLPTYHPDEDDPVGQPESGVTDFMC